MNTCVSIECPFIWYCKEYNYLVERKDGKCEHQEQILRQAKKLEKRMRADRKSGLQRDK